MSAQELTPREAIERTIARRMARATFRGWCEFVLARDGLKPARHHLMLIDYLQAVCDGKIKRLIVEMPPGSAKSFYGSRFFPPYFMSKHKGAQIIEASAGLDLAKDFSGHQLVLLNDLGPILGISALNDSKELWYTSNGNRVKATGVSGDIAGSRSDLTIIDDPFGGRSDADSPAKRKEVYDWFRGDIIGRQKPNSRIVIINTRWHEDDLAGRLKQDNPDKWTVLRLPALAEANDPLGRAIGEALWPEWESLQALEEKKAEVGEREWASQYQQRPAPASGLFFEVDKMTVVPFAPEGRRVRSWDLAASEQIGSRNPDWTAGVKMMLGPNNLVLVEDVVRARGGPQEIEKLIVETAETDGKSVEIQLPQDPGQAGKSQVAYLVSKLHGYVVSAGRPTGTKQVRAQPAASQVNVGNVKLVAGAWHQAFRDELAVFPNGTKDDQVDAFADGYAKLLGPKKGGTATVQRLRY